MTGGTAYDRVVAALRRRVPSVKANERQGLANCPAHDDRHPSLGITRIEGSVLIKCRSQDCHIDDILAAIGLVKTDLYDEPSGAVYRYDDGRTVHRTADKRFRQSGNTKGPAQLYRRTKVVEAVAAGTTIYVVEGEKDVHAMEALGAVATTSPMGAANWDKTDPTPLTGATHVVILPDRDEAGVTYAGDVAGSLRGLADSVEVRLPKVGKDAADHIAAGYGLDDLEPAALPQPAPPKDGDGHDDPDTRAIRLTKASRIKIRPVHWLWAERMALGTLALLGGREGVGKSTVAYTLVADITRGRMPGRHHGTPKAAIVAATEDSWEHTIVPRLMAAHADLDMVYRVDVAAGAGFVTNLSLPRDLHALEESVIEVDAALILLDPLMSRLDTKLDSHKDAEVRIALEPLVALADRTATTVIGLIHVNKTSTADPLTMLMASRAFAAVARAVLFVMKDPDDEAVRLLGEPKNNLGRVDLPTLTFAIAAAHVADTDEGPVFTGRVEWTGEREQSIGEALEAAGEASGDRSAAEEAAGWLEDYLTSQGGTDDSASLKREGAKAGHSLRTLHRARERIRATVSAQGFPRRTYWTLRDIGAKPDAAVPAAANPLHESGVGDIFSHAVYGETLWEGTASTTGQNGHPPLSSGASGASRAVSPRARECADCRKPTNGVRCPDCLDQFVRRTREERGLT